MEKIIVIVGPTGSGKTKLGINIAKNINGVLINADAFQVYKEITIGTAKALKEELDNVQIYNNDCISIYDEWDIKIFQEKANEIIKEVIKQKKVPIIVGGSNLYVEALIYNYDLSAQPRDDRFEKLSNEELYQKISDIDKETAKTLQIQNRRRMIRALQILENNEAFRKKNEPLYDFLLIKPYYEKEILIEKIKKNVIKMIGNGWEEEVISLYKKDPSVINTNAFKAIGYLTIINNYLNNEKTDIALITKKTCQYAKRQITWIKNRFCNAYVSIDFEQTLEKIKTFLSN